MILLTQFLWGSCVLLGLALLVVAWRVFVVRTGDDVSRGFGIGAFILGSVALVLVILLNQFGGLGAKIVAVLILASPILLIQFDRGWIRFQQWKQRRPSCVNADGTPMFAEERQQTIAMALDAAALPKIQTLIATFGPDVLKPVELGPSLLGFALSKATFATIDQTAHLDCLKDLMNRGAVFSADELAEPPLARAAFAGNTAVAELLIRHGADVNAKTKSGKPMLFDAIIAYQQPNETVELFLKHGADVNIEWDGTTALREAVRNGRWAIARMLLSHGATVSANETELRPMIDAVPSTYQGDGYSKREDYEAVKELFLR